MANHHHGTDETPDLMTPKQVMELLQVSKATLYAWVHRGVIPYIKLTTTDNDERGLLRFPRDLILEWIGQRQRGAK